jgi:hypothetical protein
MEAPSEQVYIVIKTNPKAKINNRKEMITVLEELMEYCTH